jgi:hypothetical protein
LRELTSKAGHYMGMADRMQSTRFQDADPPPIAARSSRTFQAAFR